MADIVNLNRYRKERERAQKRAEADANAAKHGRSKVEQLLDTLRAEKAARNLDDHQRERATPQATSESAATSALKDDKAIRPTQKRDTKPKGLDKPSQDLPPES